MIAEYWKDGPRSELPPGHWALFAEFVSRRDRHTIDQDAQTFFAQSNALLDAGIMSWGVKRPFDSVRPVTRERFCEAEDVDRFEPVKDEDADPLGSGI